jgi:hypothetical protein
LIVQHGLFAQQSERICFVRAADLNAHDLLVPWQAGILADPPRPGDSLLGGKFVFRFAITR